MTDFVGTAIGNTIQSLPKSTDEYGGGFATLLSTLTRAGTLLPPWWSKSRDIALRNFWKQSDHLSGVMYTLSTKMATIPIRVVPRDRSIQSHVKIANYYTDLLLKASDFGDGWVSLLSKFIEDYAGTDNGGFMEVIGPGDKTGPLEGGAIGLANLDSVRCQRTSSAEFPVVYTDYDGAHYKLHYSRVIFASQMPSPKAEMFKVGFCAVSRSINVAQNLVDMSIYKQEKLGSRPIRQWVIAKGGLDPEDINDAIVMSEGNMNSAGLTRYSKTVAIGDRNIPNADVKTIDVASLPDGFDERESTTLAMAAMSLAWGLDARELFPALEAGATKADSIIQHIKQRTKAPGQIIQIVSDQIDNKFLPPFLQLMFDFQDDTQDRQRADISNVRAQARERDLKNKVTSPRVEREKMLENGELTSAQFIELELGDGRLEDGTEVTFLFQSKDQTMVEFLGGVDESNFEERKDMIVAKISGSRDPVLINKGRQAIAAIDAKFEKPLQTNQARTASQPPDTSYQQEKFGRKLPLQAGANAGDETINFQPNKVGL